jgi:hypothetical protein
VPYLWTFAFIQLAITAFGILQLFEPVLKYFPVWLIFVFLTGGIEGLSTTNTYYKIATDCVELNEPDDVRSFAMSYGALGCFVGDMLGGAFSILIQQCALKFLPVRGN